MRTWIKSILVVLLSVGVIWAAGAYAPYGYRYIPQLTTQGTTDYNQIVINETATDALLHTLDLGFGVINTKSALYKTLGDVGYETLSAAVTSAGVFKTTLFVPAGAWVGGGVIVPPTMTLNVQHGGYFTVANGTTLTINGPIEAGPYQIFSWTGTGAINISGSPTKDCPLEWWGGVAAKTTDNSAVLIKAAASVGADQTICLASGEYGLLTATVIGDSATANNTTYGFHIKGMGPALTRLYINTPGEDGLTLGAVTANSSVGNNNLSLEGFSVVGPTTCCTNGIKIVKWHDARIDLNFFLGGASAYALDMQSCLWAKVNVSSGRTYNNWTYYWPNPGWPSASYPNAFHFESTSDNWGFNVGEFNVEVKQQYHNIGVLMDGTQGGSAIHLTGSIEDCMEPLNITNWTDVVVDVHYMIDNNQSGPTITNCQRVTLNNVLAEYGAITTSIINSRMTTINNCQLAVLSIDANCIGTTINNLATASITDLAPDTQYFGRVSVGGNTRPNAPQPTRMSDRRNLMPNTLFNQWATTKPSAWIGPSNGTWTQCGTSLADTTNHKTDFCALFTTSGGNGQDGYTLSSQQLKEFLGRVLHFSVWTYAPDDPQTFTNHVAYVLVDATVPTWANGVAYTVGQAVIPTVPNGYMYVCTVAGTSGGTEPSPWPVVSGTTISEGTGKPTWQCFTTINTNGYASYTTTPFKQSQVGKWTQLVTGGYIPTNSSAITISFVQYRQDGAAESKVYWAEPCLMVGWQGPDSVLPSVNYIANSLTLATGAGATTTTVNDPNVTAYSKIILTATSAAAAAAVGSAGGVYVAPGDITPGASFKVTHPANPGASCTMDYMIIN